MVGRICVCRLWGTSAHSENHCPSLVITCSTGGELQIPAQIYKQDRWPRAGVTDRACSSLKKAFRVLGAHHQDLLGTTPNKMTFQP